jgi:hypothetical protein
MMLQGHVLFAELERAGVISDASQVSRVVIDVPRAGFVTVHIQLVGDKKLLEVTRLLSGVELIEVTAGDDGGA